MANYVKFMRGTPAAWERLVQKNDDTLYFIAEADANTGRLYLGAKEIVCDNDVSVATALSQLTDVQLPELLKEGQVLMYHIDGENEYWTAQNIQEIVTGDLSELQDQVDTLTTSVETNAAAIEDLDTRVAGAEAAVAGIDNKIKEAVTEAGHLTRAIVDSIEEIDLEKDDGNTVYMVKNGEKYDEYMVVDGKLEKLGDWTVDLSGYYTSEQVDEKLNALDLGDENYVKSVSSDFAVSEVGKLSLNDLPQSKVTGLEDAVKSFQEFMANQAKKDAQQDKSLTQASTAISEIHARVGDLNSLFEAVGKESTTIVEEILELREMLAWGSIEE